MGREVRRQPAELIAECGEQTRREIVPPTHTGVDAHRVGGVGEPKNIWIREIRILKRELAGEIVLAADLFLRARLQAVLMCDRDDGDLVVIAAGEVGFGIILQQGQRFRADPARGDHVVEERQAGGGVDDGRRNLREISTTQRVRRHEAGCRASVSVARQLVIYGEVWAVAEQVRNAYGAPK